MPQQARTIVAEDLTEADIKKLRELQAVWRDSKVMYSQS